MPVTDISARSGKTSTRVRPFQLRGRFFTAISLRLGTAPLDAEFFEALDAQLRQTPNFFESAPLVIDLEEAGAQIGQADISKLVRQLRLRSLSPFGVLNATGRLAMAAEAVGLIRVSVGHDAPLGGRGEGEAQSDLPEPPVPPANRLITTPVRSGQTVVADRGDLVIVGSVSSGAELVASGNIHIYGRLRGRALAGIHGDESARIFCQNLDAELVAIAGLYRTSENLEAEVRGRSVQISLQDESLRMDLLG